jgi:hypothetical protein
MKGFFYISLLVIAFGSSSCNSQGNNAEELNSVNDSLLNLDNPESGQIYVNEYGQVELVQLDDSTWQTIFTNKDGFVFDTTLISDQRSSYLKYRDSSAVFLPYSWGGVDFTESELWVTEYSSYGKLGSEAQMFEMYERPFYRIDQKLDIQANVHLEKDGPKVNGMYVSTDVMIENGFYNVTGTIKKEKYPIAYYSTDESPQGKLGNDTTQIYYRLILENPTFEKPSRTLYGGSKVNSGNQAAFAWNLADSQAYMLYGESAWSENEVGEAVLIEGHLQHSPHGGSVLQNWEAFGKGEEIEISGKTLNIEGVGGIDVNNSLFIPYLLEGHSAWPEDELNKGISVKGKIYFDGIIALIKDYKILN